MITIPVNSRGRTVIGRLGENEHRCIAFRDSAAVLQMYPSATVTVLHQRPGDPAAYPVGSQYVAIDSGVVKWMVQSGDLSAAGCGQCELVFIQGGIVAKTMIYQTEILPALDGAGEPPEPWEGWVTEVAEDAAEARAWANGTKQDGSPVDPDASQYENNAKYHADRAQQIVDGIGDAGEEQIKAIEDKGEEVLDSIPQDYQELADAVDDAPTDATGQDVLAAMLAENVLLESALAVIGMTFDALPSDETAVDILNAISLEADRLSAIYDLWLAEKEGA